MNKHEELTNLIARAISDDGACEALPGVWVHRRSVSIGPIHGRSQPAFCVIAQGSKDVRIGTRTFHYDSAHYLIASIELPIISEIRDASPERPYLSLRLDLDPMLVGSVIVDAGVDPVAGSTHTQSIDVSELNSELLDATVRLLQLVDRPRDRQFLVPLVIREIVYLLLRGDQGGRLQQIALHGGSSQRVLPAIERMRREFNRPIRIETMARDAGMSVSSFHHQFKRVTAMSPIQFQKQLRLQEARRLILSEDLDAANAGFTVGYEDASHFNRDYKRLFGAPPMRDAARLRKSVLAGTYL